MEFVPKIETSGLNLYYSEFAALTDINIRIPERNITSIIGPSGCGKSTLLRCFNRMNDLIENVRISGQILFNGRDIYHPGVNLTRLRRRVGMVFQRPNPFPLSVFDNVAYGRRVHGLGGRGELEAAGEKSLRATDLWEA